MAADDMDVVCEEFIGWLNSNMKIEEVTMLVVYNGETYNLKWLWKLTQAPCSPYNLLPKWRVSWTH